jgi:hypothetical protein
MTAENIDNTLLYPLAHNLEPIVAAIVFVLTCLSILVFFSLLVLRIRKARFEKESESLKLSLNGLLIAAALASTHDELYEVIHKAKPEFIGHIKNSRQAKFMNDEIFTMLDSLTGQAKDNLSQLFLETCLMTYTLKNLYHKNWHSKASAIKVLAQLNAKTHISRIEEYAIDPNINLQQVAQIALVNLKGYDGLDFLGRMNNALSDWQQINILEILEKLDTSNLPDFSRWLSHKEDTIKLFSIRLIHCFQQGYNMEKVESFIHDKNKLLRDEAIATLQGISFGQHFTTSNAVTL